MRRGKLNTITIVINLTIMLFGLTNHTWWWSALRKEFLHSPLGMHPLPALPKSLFKMLIPEAYMYDEKFTVRAAAQLHVGLLLDGSEGGHGSWCFWKRVVTLGHETWYVVCREVCEPPWTTVVSINAQTSLRETSTLQHLTASGGQCGKRSAD